MNKYTEVEQIGRGGNGIVSKVTDGTNEFAKKTIINSKNKVAYKRFRDEIAIIKNTPHGGIIEILDFYIPKENDGSITPYYVMPLGLPIKDYLLKGISLDKMFNIILSLIDTIEYLHTKDITHRDIKIENILMIDNSPKISDFGLANFPKQKRISKLNEKIGPAFTIAPEMKRISSSAEYKKADIYSLAKTIWVILTKNWLSFDGQYNSHSSIGLNNYVDVKINKMTEYDVTYYHSLVILEKLLSNATHNDPEKRPTIKEFKDQFEFWLVSNNDYFQRNAIEWRDAIERIFPISVAHSSVWTNILHIQEILDILFSKYDQLNHSFYPSSGGNDFTHVELVTIRNTDYLYINKSYLIKPSRLLFEYMDDFEWSYFRLEFEPLKPFFGNDVYEKEEHIYIDESFNIFENNKSYEEEEEDSNYNLKSISVFLEGSILIVQKTANVNNLGDQFDHYLGLHNKMDNTEYKNLLMKIKKHFRKIK